MELDNKWMVIGIIGFTCTISVMYVTELIIKPELMETCISQPEMEYVDGDCRRIQPAE